MLSKTSAQIVKALVELSRLPEGEYAGAKTIASRIKAPQNYLGKVLQNLSYAGIVISQKGLGGGFRLKKSPEEISLYEVVEQIDNIDSWTGCPLNFKKCSDSHPCAAHYRVKSVRGAYTNFLKTLSIADLAK